MLRRLAAPKDRRNFLRVASALGAGGTLVGLGLYRPEARAYHRDPKFLVQVHGRVEGVSGQPPPNGFRTVIGNLNVLVLGTERDLGGAGFVYVDDPELGATPAATICVFHQRGAFTEEGQRVDVQGKVFYAGEAETVFRNLLVRTRANLRTGTIVFDFGPHVFRTTSATGRGLAFKSRVG
jgi:hypothetical protein